jgi:hypothetical protein
MPAAPLCQPRAERSRLPLVFVIYLQKIFVENPKY